MRVLPAILVLSLLLAGCSGKETPSQTTTDDGPSQDPGIREDNGADSNDTGPAPGQVRKTILEQDFVIDSNSPGGTDPVTVPSNVTHVWLTMDYTFGAFQDAGFTLGGCHHVSTDTSTAVYTPNGQSHLNGNVSPGELFDCGAMPAGAASISWSLTGHAEGHLTVFADVPA